MPDSNLNDLNLIWIDLEMTGLNPVSDKIIEIATVVTDAQLNILAEGPTLAIGQSASTMSSMDDWNTNQHGKSGLTERVLASDITIEQAEKETIEFISKWVPHGKSPMCGNSIHQDRRFLVKYMPDLEAFFHYRNLDVSTLKELARRWSPEILPGFQKQGSHLALDDIIDSIRELDYYRSSFMKL